MTYVIRLKPACEAKTHNRNVLLSHGIHEALEAFRTRRDVFKQLLPQLPLWALTVPTSNAPPQRITHVAVLSLSGTSVSCAISHYVRKMRLPANGGVASLIKVDQNTSDVQHRGGVVL